MPVVGNRKTKTENGFTTTYQYNENNQLVTEDDITYSYDDNGNLKEKTSAEENVKYHYDAENHLTRVETTRFGVTIVVEYEYDADGNRVRKIIDGTIVTNYLVDTNRDYTQVLEERDGSGNLLVRYVYGHDLISQERGGATSYYHYDGLGSTRALTSSSEAVTDTYNYDAFGNLLDKTGTTTNNHLFTGEFFDANIGFYYLRARYMNPANGRFITMDPFAGRNRDPYSLHKYLYAHANPVTYIDPSGYILDLPSTTVATEEKGKLDATVLAAERIVLKAIIKKEIVFWLRCVVYGMGFAVAVGGDTAEPARDKMLRSVSTFVTNEIAMVESGIRERPERTHFWRGLSAEDVKEHNDHGFIFSKALREGFKMAVRTLMSEPFEKLAKEHGSRSFLSPFVSVTTSEFVAIEFSTMGPDPGYEVAEIITLRAQPNVSYNPIRREEEWLVALALHPLEIIDTYETRPLDPNYRDPDKEIYTFP